MIAGIGGGVRNGTVAVAEGGRLAAVCSQERATPDEALDLMLQRLGRSRGPSWERSAQRCRWPG